MRFSQNLIFIYKTKKENIHSISITLHLHNWRKSDLKMASSFECQLRPDKA